MVTEMFAGGAWGWHIETAVHVIRIISAACSTAFRNCRSSSAIMGEGLPFMFQRFDIMPPAVTKLKRPISDYLRENIHYTFSGFNFPPTFLDLLLELGGVDRIMFSADHPYQSMPKARAFLEQIAGQRRRQGAHRPRQRGEAVQAVAARRVRTV